MPGESAGTPRNRHGRTEHLRRRARHRVIVGTEQPPCLIVDQGDCAEDVNRDDAFADAVQDRIVRLQQGSDLLRLQPVDPAPHHAGYDRRPSRSH